MWTIVAGVLVLVVAVVGSRLVGRALKTRPPAWYIVADAVVVLIALALIAASSMLVAPGSPVGDALYGVGLGFGFGGLAGLRYGYKGLFEVHSPKAES
jgi:uncharacterized membrane protein